MRYKIFVESQMSNTLTLGMKKYLVLGGEGFIGSYLVSFLRQNGNEVDVIDFKTDTTQDLRYLKIKKLSFYDGCFFLAWNVGGAKYLNNKTTWQEQYSDNVALIHNVFPQLAKSAIPFLFVSSQLAGSDFSPYSITKLLGEKYALTLQNAVIARQWNAYGAIEESDIKSHVISDMISQAVRNREISLITTGEEERKFLHLQDICDAYIRLIQHHIGGIFDVAAGEPRTILEIAEIIASRTDARVVPGKSIGINPKVVEIPPIPNWTPKVEFLVGIEEMIVLAREKYQPK
jgi:nucleoside-diphosphate-sugar epimerase